MRLTKGASLVHPLDGVSDQECAKKIGGLDHRKASKKPGFKLLKSIEATQNAGADWVVITKLPLGSASLCLE